MMRKALYFLAIVMWAAPALAEDVNPQMLLARANGAFQGGRYDEAAANFRQLAEAGYDTADVHFNYGTSALRAGHRGEAILALRRALRIDPEDQDAAFNLDAARKGNIDKIVGTREEEPLVERIGARVPAQFATRLFLATWWIGLLALFGAARLGREWLAWAGGVTVAASLVLGALTGTAAYHRHHSTHGVVVAASTQVREGPAADFKASFEIHEGLEVRVVANDGEFARIRLPNGVEGWVASKDVPTI